MKNLVNRIELNEDTKEYISSPHQIEGYYNLTSEEQNLVEELPSYWWGTYIRDILSAKAIDSKLQQILK